MLIALTAEGSLPVCRVTCDEGFGCGHAFLDGVVALGLGLAEVPRTPMSGLCIRSRGAGPPLAPGCPAGGLPGTPGPSIIGAVLRVVTRRGREPGPDVWLLLCRNPVTDELKLPMP